MHSRARGHEADGLGRHTRARVHSRSFALRDRYRVRHAGVRAYAPGSEVAAKVTASSVRELLHVGFSGACAADIAGLYFSGVFSARANGSGRDEAAVGTRWPGAGINRVYTV